MALYDIYKLHTTVKHENGKNVFYHDGSDIIDVTAYADDITTEHKQFIVDTMISMGHLTNEASLDDLDVIYVGDCGVGISDKRTGYPLFDIIKRDSPD